MIYFCVFDTLILQREKLTSTVIRKVTCFFFFFFIFSFLIHILVLNKHPKEKYSTAAGSNKEAENGKTTVLRKPMWKHWLCLPGYRKQIELFKALANKGLPNKILFYEVRKKLILKVIVGYLWSRLVFIKHDVILNPSLFLFQSYRFLSETRSQQL